MAAVIAFSFGAPFEFTTSPGMPNLNPAYWWGEDTGWKLGLPDWSHFIAVLPFAVLAVSMWSPDLLGHQVFQKLSYPKKSERAHMNIDDTMIAASSRQAVGSLLGGGNISSSWGTYIIPASIARRPIPGGALVTGFMRCSGTLGLPHGSSILAASALSSAYCWGLSTANGSRYANDA